MTRRLGWFLLCATLGLVSGASAEWKVFVGADAAPGGDGSQGAPCCSLAQARDAIRAARKAGTLKPGDPVTVMVGAGSYGLDASFDLTSVDSGSPGAEVVYRAEKHGQARIRGGISLPPASFKALTDDGVSARLNPAVREKILVCDLSTMVTGTLEPFKTAYKGPPVGPWLYIDGQPMTLARWPDIDAPEAGWTGFTKAVDSGLAKADADPAQRKPRPGSFVFEDSRPERWNLQEGVWLLGYWTHDWCDEVIRVAAYDKERKVITLAAPHGYGIMAGT